MFLIEQLDRETTKSYVLMVEARNKRQKVFSLLHVEVLYNFLFSSVKFMFQMFYFC